MEYIIYNSETRQFSKPKTAEEYEAKIAKLQGKVQDAREGMKISRGEYAKKYAKRGAAIGAAAGGIGGSLLAGNVVGAGVRAAATGMRAVSGAVNSGAAAIGHGVNSAVGSTGNILSSGMDHLTHGVKDIHRSYSNPFKATSNISEAVSTSVHPSSFTKPGIKPHQQYYHRDLPFHGQSDPNKGTAEWKWMHRSDNASHSTMPTPIKPGLVPSPLKPGQTPEHPQVHHEEVPHEITTGGIVGGGIIGSGVGAAVGAGTGAILGYTKHKRLGRSIERNMRKIAKLERDKQKLNK